uniref:UBX domain-containing protein n=1 Tax=Ditylenchus dipsaci TaxID=166011 RepID=A0A915EDH8_9BILA
MSEENAGTSNEPVQVVQALNQFKEVCDVDTAIARNYLNESDWDLEAAIHLYFHSNDPEAIENQDNRMQELRRRQIHTPASSTPVTPSVSSNGTVRAQPVGGWLQLVRSLFAVPMQFVYSSVTKVFLFLYVLLFNPNLPVTRRRENRRLQDNTEAEEEYARSLAADKAKREERLRAELVFKEEEQRAKDQAEKAENKRRRLLQKRDEVRYQMKEEPKNGDDIVCIKVKFSEGSVFSRRFRANHSVEELFNSVLLHEKCPDDFSLLSGYPATALNCVPAWYEEFGPHGIQDPEKIPTFADAGFEKTAVILVRDNDA